MYEDAWDWTCTGLVRKGEGSFIRLVEAGAGLIGGTFIDGYWLGEDGSNERTELAAFEGFRTLLEELAPDADRAGDDGRVPPPRVGDAVRDDAPAGDMGRLPPCGRRGRACGTGDSERCDPLATLGREADLSLVVVFDSTDRKSVRSTSRMVGCAIAAFQRVSHPSLVLHSHEGTGSKPLMYRRNCGSHVSLNR